MEFFGISDRVIVTRKVASLTTLLKNKKIEDANLHVRNGELLSFKYIVLFLCLQIENTKIENVSVRIARPLNDREDLPAIIYFHGGAFYMGSVGEFDL